MSKDTCEQGHSAPGAYLQPHHMQYNKQVVNISGSNPSQERRAISHWMDVR